MANTFSSWDSTQGGSVEDFLYSQIAQQRLSGLGSWSGGLDPETSMRSMAMDLGKSGITSLGQLAWSDKAERPVWEGVAQGATLGGGSGGGIDNQNFGGYTEDDPYMGRWTSGIVNKDTGKLLHSAYGERTQGNTWSGSYAGKGNTGFDINFDAEGNPIFGTHGASSVDKSHLAMGGAALAGLGMFAAPMVVGALGSGGGLGGVGANAAGTGAITGGAEMVGGDVLGDFIASLGAQEPFVQGGAAAYTGPMSLGWDGAGATGGGTDWMSSLTKSLNLTNPDGTVNAANALKMLMSTGSGLYGMSQANKLGNLSQQALAGSAPWTTSGGTAMAGDELKRVISGDLANDPGFKLAQQAAARATSQQPGGMSASAAALAALKYQNDRIGALSGPAGVGFNPASGYSTALQGQGAASSLASSSLGSIGYGATSSSMPPWLQQYLIKQGMGAVNG